MALTRVFHDTFTGSADTKLNSHTPDEGNGYTVTRSGAATSADDLELDGSGLLRRQSANSSSTYYRLDKAASASWNSDQAISIKVAVAANVVSFNLILRASSLVTATDFNGYTLLVNASNYYIREYTGTSVTNHRNNVSLGGNLANNDVIEFRAVGSTLSFWRNGSQVDSVTDTTYTSGDPYMQFSGTSFNGALDDLEGFDDAGGGGGGGVLIAACFM